MNPSLTLTRPRNAQDLLRIAALIAIGVALLTLSAKLRVPSWPVPMTLQTMAVMAIALTTGPRMAMTVFASYLVAGAAGLPVFSGTPERGIGLAYMAGPTGGYLLGYLIASGLTGAMAQGRGHLGRVIAMLAGLAVTYICGLAWLAVFVPASGLIAAGFTPFIIGDLMKIATVALAAALILNHRKAAQ